MLKGTDGSIRTRRTRIVCISDTHNSTVKLPSGDVLIHAGDLTNSGSFSELSKAVQWLEKADFEAKIVIAGNHDITLDESFYSEYGPNFHGQNIDDPARCLALLRSSPSITYLNHESATISLQRESGPQTTFTIFGSPYSPRRGQWAFGYTRSDSLVPSEADETSRPAGSSVTALPLPADRDLWTQIPFDTDIVVTHTPPFTHCDESASARRALGCEALRQTLWQVRPRMAICGHVHEGRGAERVLWNINGIAKGRHVAYAEASVERWDDPGRGNSKLSLVDLTARGRSVPLRNDGARCPGPAEHETAASQFPDNTIDMSEDTVETTADPGIGVFGAGGDPRSARCDRQALQGRMGRKETCIVNCAIMANSYPHTGGKRYNKPIVVDIDLPVWQAGPPSEPNTDIAASLAVDSSTHTYVCHLKPCALARAPAIPYRQGSTVEVSPPRP